MRANTRQSQPEELAVKNYHKYQDNKPDGEINPGFSSACVGFHSFRIFAKIMSLGDFFAHFAYFLCLVLFFPFSAGQIII